MHDRPSDQSTTTTIVVATLEHLYEVLVALADAGLIDFDYVREVQDALAIARDWQVAA